MKQGKLSLQLHKRVKLAGTAVVHDTETVVVLDILNMSEGGIFLSKGKNVVFELGKTVSMTLKSPRFSEPIRAKGIVVRKQRKKPEGFAIEFQNLTKKAQQLLHSSVQEISVETALNASAGGDRKIHPSLNGSKFEKRDLC